MWHEVPNRGVCRPNVPAERANGDIDLTSAWQGDNAGNAAVRATAAVDQPHWLKLAIARQATARRCRVRSSAASSTAAAPARSR